MKRFYFVTPLVFAAFVISGCSDAKVPSPLPKVPTPKAEKTAEQPPALAPSRGLVQRLEPAVTA